MKGYMLSARGITSLEFPKDWEEYIEHNKGKVSVKDAEVTLKQGCIIGSPCSCGKVETLKNDINLHLDEALYISSDLVTNLLTDSENTI